MSKAEQDVLAERQRQIDEEGWTPEHDDAHIGHQLAYAAQSYLYPSYSRDKFPLTNLCPLGWPWDESQWKPKSYRQNLVRAGALIIAEIERLDRQEDSDE